MYCLKTGIAASMHFILLTMPASITVTIRILAVVKVLTFGSIAVSICWAGKRMRIPHLIKPMAAAVSGKSNTLYLERGIAELLGTLRAGDQYTSSEIFDSVRFTGVRLFRDMQMLPNSKQNFTPLVQGIAQTNALVTIEQNGFVVYQKEVPLAPFPLRICNSRAVARILMSPCVRRMVR